MFWIKYKNFPSNRRQVGSSIFGFNDNKTIVSYVPKKNKVVILLSTVHHVPVINENGKPEIIMFYNKTKGGVDTLDNLVERFTCRRKTNRWPFNIMMFLLDVCAYNSYILYCIKNPSVLTTDMSRQRRECLQNLSISLLRPAIEDRVAKFAQQNFKGMHYTIRESFMRTGFTININKIDESEQASNTSKAVKRTRCGFCKNDNKYRETCNTCNITVCGKHSQTTIICENCLAKQQ